MIVGVETSSFGKTYIINLALSDIVGSSALLTKINKPSQLIKRLNSVGGSVKIKQHFKDISGKSKIDTRHNLEAREKIRKRLRLSVAGNIESNKELEDFLNFIDCPGLLAHARICVVSCQ